MFSPGAESLYGDSNFPPSPETTLQTAASMIAIELISQGQEHNVDIPLITIFQKIMDAMEAQTPVFHYWQNEHGLYQLSVEFMVPANYANGPSQDYGTVDGEACPSIKLAENSAMKRVFEYLARVHRIAVMDYSSTVIEKYEDRIHNMYQRVNSVKDALEYMLQQWDESMKKAEKLNLALEKKIMDETVAAASKIFCDVGELFRSIIQRFRDSYNSVCEEYQKLEAEHRDYVKASDHRNNLAMFEAPRKKVWFNEKDVIDYLMSYLGTMPARYSNESVEKYSFKGEVKMLLPHIPGVACGGVTKVTGTVESTAARSEEKAAGAAIRFLERHMKFRVIDHNYAERLNAKARKEAIKNLEARFCVLGTKIKEEWSSMLENTRTAKELYGERSSFWLSAPTDDQIKAFQFCSQEIYSIGSDCASRYENAVSMLDAVKK
ncbi:hypothetical protein ACP70R_028241 [Stipagrostis hirtigluma subsp. patula]